MPTFKSQPSALTDSFLNGSSSQYVDEMYLQWREDPTSVHKSWDVFFNKGVYTPPPTLEADYSGSSGDPSKRTSTSTAPVPSGASPTLAKVIQMIRAFQVRGHFMARLDPLNINQVAHTKVAPQELQLEYYNFSEEELNQVVPVGFTNMKGFLSTEVNATVRDIHKRLTEAYSGTVGVEYMHIPDVNQCNWIREKFETEQKPEYSKDVKVRMLDRLMWADHFENFLAKKYATAKRFGLEGVESMIPGMKHLIDAASDYGVENIVMGMPHRGRLNVLTNVVRKPLEQIFSEFAGAGEYDDTEGSGDVKYHLGMSHSRPCSNGKKINLSLVANPSHLEAVNPVVAGKSRAKQFRIKDAERKRVMPVLLHGDAAFAGQGVVYETLGMQQLPDYTVGGTVHIIANNQIGFTTDPSASRSAPYCTDVAKSIGAPIFHVNGDDVEAVAWVCDLAAEWRQTWGTDVVVDIVGYRKHGHNEIDEPSFTQPRMYETIRKQPNTLERYREKLIKEGTITKDEAKSMSERINSFLEEKFAASKEHVFQPSEWLAADWKSMKGADEISPARPTGVDIEHLKHIGKLASTLPEDFTLHKRLQPIFKTRLESCETGEGIDWATAEALAFGTLCDEGYRVRLSGQDVERGTFSHRHARVHDQKSYRSYVPLQHIREGQGWFSASNSHLSEFGVLGFELGYSLEHPDSLVLWEAQFGDFANGAQVIIDQFISSGEAKWRRQSGLVMLLPHGYEGQGPEHSSARLERFLQMSADHPSEVPEMGKDSRQIQQTNWQVINATTPANYFHALRRQLHRDFRKPLIVMSPKSLLKHKQAKSTLSEMQEGTEFQRVIPETDDIDPSKVRRILFCSGKVYYDLYNYRAKNEVDDIAIVRVEQISPFPFDLVKAELERYPNAEVKWVQEEPMNQGAWAYVEPRIFTSSDFKSRADYIGRAPSASTATGSTKNHNQELEAFLEAAFSKSS